MLQGWSLLLVIVQIVCAIGVIILVLLQHGKGADMGAAFGSGTSGSLFGATGSANFLSRMTAGFATVFFVATLGLAFVATNKPKSSAGGVMQSVPAAPAVPGGAPSAAPAAEGGAAASPAATSATAAPAAAVPAASAAPAVPGGASTDKPESK